MRVASGKVCRAAETLQGIGREMLAAKPLNHRFERSVKRFSRVVLKLARLANLVGTRIKRQQRFEGDGPARVSQIVTPLEVNCIQRHATSTPDGGTASKSALPISVRLAVHLLVDDRAFVQLLYGV